MYKYVSDAYNLYYFIQTSDFSQEIVKKNNIKMNELGVR